MLIPPAMAAYQQFVLWTSVPSKTRPGKTDKFPVNPYTGKATDAHDQSSWLTGEQALQHLNSPGVSGIGFVFTENDPFFFFDVDDCLNDGTWSEAAQNFCQAFNGCFIEVSHSGKGLHIIGTGSLPAHGTRNKQYGLELYTKLRFCALTGNGAVGDPAFMAQAPLNWLVGLPGWSGGTTGGEAPAEWTTGPSFDWSGPESDADLIHKMLNSKPSAASVFGNKATVAQLWHADVAALSAAFPDNRPEGFDWSSADAALCAHLAFWTGRDCDRIDRIFRQSALYRSKWDERRGEYMYGEKTILGAVGKCQHVLSSGAAPAVQQPPGEPTARGVSGLRDGLQVISVPGQIDHFESCVYIRELHRIWIPDGSLLKPDQFKATYGGYTFALDMGNEKTTKSAWEAFTESQGYNFPKVHDACFRPECLPGTIIEEESRQMVNIYVPITTPAIPGDAGRFLLHVNKLLPVQADADILLAYMAALVQYPGVKFQWTPLVQGMEGNGKTLLVTCLSNAIGRRYTHLPNANDISNKFNAWLLGKLFIGVEEVYVADRREAIETLKPLITNDRVDIQGKGDNQATGDNRANFFMCSNHRDAIRKTWLDRRYCVFYTDQQEPGDLERCGMAGDYFPDLYNWLRDGGFAIVNHFLRSYQIPDALNPATSCQRAPITSTTADAVRQSLGSIEQEIVEAIEEGRPGFAGGFISSLAFTEMLAVRHDTRRIPPNKQRDLLKGLGYDYHPAMPGGRVHNAINDCGRIGKPRLYIRSGHIILNTARPADVVKCYQDAQSGASSLAQAFSQAPVSRGELNS